jgi:hypothetical protein
LDSQHKRTPEQSALETAFVAAKVGEVLDLTRDVVKKIEDRIEAALFRDGSEHVPIVAQYPPREGN